METFISKRPPALEHKEVITDILSHAITGELIGMSNLASLAGAVDDVDEKMEAVALAECERNHAESFIALSKKYDLEPVINLEGYYWKRIRECFLTYARQKDFTGCVVIQEVMLQCFAVSTYQDISKALDNEIGELFSAVSREEEAYLEYFIELLQTEMAINRDAFLLKVEKIHKVFMTILAEWTAKEDLKGHCGVCKGACMKNAMPAVSLDISIMRGNALNLYLRTLERIGLPTEKTLRWIINLPA